MIRITNGYIEREVHEQDFTRFKEMGFEKMEEPDVKTETKQDKKTDEKPKTGKGKGKGKATKEEPEGKPEEPVVITTEDTGNDSDEGDDDNSDEENYLEMEVADLEALLDEKGIDHTDVTEKADLLALIP